MMAVFEVVLASINAAVAVFTVATLARPIPVIQSKDYP